MRGLCFLALVLVLPLSAGAEGAPALAPAAERKDVEASPFDAPVNDRRDVPSLDLQKSEGDEELSLGWVLFRTMVVLGIVVALAYLTLNVGMRKLLGIRTTGGARGLVEVLERVPLDQKRVLFVVRAGEELLLVGGSDVSLNLITKLDSASVDKLKAETPPPSLQLSPFLQKLLGRKDAPPPPAA